MRWILVALAVAGCAAPPQLDRARLAHDQQAALGALAEVATWNGHGAPAATLARWERDRQAPIICAARGQMAGSQPVFGGFGVQGAIAAGMQQAWASANVEAACVNAYRATGIMPSF